MREYGRFFAKGEPLPDDMATIDHLSQKNGKEPRPVPGATVLACWPCNNDRGRNGQPEREKLPCAECGGAARTRFCSEACFRANTARLIAHPRPWEQDRARYYLDRRKEKNRRRQRRRRARRQRPADVFFADKTELGWRVAVSLLTENRRPGRMPSGPTAQIALHAPAPGEPGPAVQAPP